MQSVPIYNLDTEDKSSPQGRDSVITEHAHTNFLVNSQSFHFTLVFTAPGTVSTVSGSSDKGHYKKRDLD